MISPPTLKPLSDKHPNVIRSKLSPAGAEFKIAADGSYSRSTHGTAAGSDWMEKKHVVSNHFCDATSSSPQSGRDRTFNPNARYPGTVQLGRSPQRRRVVPEQATKPQCHR